MTPPATLRRLLDGLERLIWEAQDARLTAAGFRVTRIGRWRRSYHRPLRPPLGGPGLAPPESVRSAPAGALP